MPNLSILLVDDDVVDREIVERALRDAGIHFDLTEADGADAALALLAAEPGRFELGLFDLQLPGRDGLELLTELRELGHFLPIIFLTGHGNEDTAVELMKAGAADYLAKASLSPGRLQQSIAHAMRLARLEQSKRETEQALRDSEASYRLLTRHLPDAIARFDRDGRHTYANQPPPWSRHASAAEVNGKTLAEVGPDAAMVEPLAEAVAQSLAGEPTQVTIETVSVVAVLLPEAESPTVMMSRWFEVRFVPERSLDGDRSEVSSVLAIARDVTARVMHEREEQRRIEFEHQLIGIVSHDLRNPIGAITMSAKLLDKKLATPRDDLVVRALDVLHSSAQRAARMISDILDFTKARLGGSIPMQFDECDLGAVVGSLMAETRTAHPARVIDCSIDGAVVGWFDADRIAQAVQNLIGNALAYSAPTEPISVRLAGTRAEVSLEVENRGSTIAPEVLPTLFEPFKRGSARVVGHAPTRSVGLGLFIVDQIVQGHRGRIEVESHEGVTVFRLILPRRTPSGRQKSLTPMQVDAVEPGPPN